MKTRFGKIAIDWQYKDGVFKAKIEKPEGVFATLSVRSEEREIPDGITEIEFKV